MNIVCVVPSLDIEDNKLYIKLKELLGESLVRDVSIRTSAMFSKDAKIRFVTCKQHINSVSGLGVDIAIIADPGITNEWMDFLQYRTIISDGIILNMWI